MDKTAIEIQFLKQKISDLERGKLMMHSVFSSLLNDIRNAAEDGDYDQIIELIVGWEGE